MRLIDWEACADKAIDIAKGGRRENTDEYDRLGRKRS